MNRKDAIEPTSGDTTVRMYERDRGSTRPFTGVTIAYSYIFSRIANSSSTLELKADSALMGSVPLLGAPGDVVDIRTSFEFTLIPRVGISIGTISSEKDRLDEAPAILVRRAEAYQIGVAHPAAFLDEELDDAWVPFKQEDLEALYGSFDALLFFGVQAPPSKT